MVKSKLLLTRWSISPSRSIHNRNTKGSRANSTTPILATLRTKFALPSGPTGFHVKTVFQGCSVFETLNLACISPDCCWFSVFWGFWGRGFVGKEGLTGCFRINPLKVKHKSVIFVANEIQAKVGSRSNHGHILALNYHKNGEEVIKNCQQLDKWIKKNCKTSVKIMSCDFFCPPSLHCDNFYKSKSCKVNITSREIHTRLRYRYELLVQPGT